MMQESQNGAFSGMMGPMMPMQGLPMDGNVSGMGDFASMGAVLRPLYELEEAVRLVNQHETDTEALRRRMNEDLDRYNLVQHVPKDPSTLEELTGYARYTSNAPYTYALKTRSWLEMAEVQVRAPHLEVSEHQEEQDNLKERFAIGCLRAADERLALKLGGSIKGMTAFASVVRGGVVGGRCLLAKRPDGSTYVDIQPFDPVHTFWAIGQDGPEWVCHKTRMTRTQIRREYGVIVPGGERDGSTDAEREGIDVYDFYDKQFNFICTDSEYLKLPTPHGAARVPCYLVLVGGTPQLQSYKGGQDLSATWGESIYGGLRDLYDTFNDIMSVVLHLVAMSRRQALLHFSESGTTLPDKDIRKEGSDVPLILGKEDIRPLELMGMAKDTWPFVQAVMGEIQRGSYPWTVYGELAVQLSGYAINQLSNGVRGTLAPYLAVMKQVHLQIVNLLFDQFMRDVSPMFPQGYFEGIRLSGVDKGRKYFRQTLTPGELIGTCDYEVAVVAQLPEDDMSKWAMAETAKRTQLMSDVDILNTVLEVQDAQQMIDKMMVQRAEQGLPEATMLTLGLAALDQDNKVLAGMYLAAYNTIMAQKFGMMPGGGPGPGGPQSSGGGPERGQRPEVLPQAMRGTAPEPETSNAGPAMVYPGTPRPGARGQQDQNRQL